MNVDLEPTRRKRDKLERRLKNVFRLRRSSGPGTSQDNSVALDLSVKLDDVEQDVPRPGADMANWNECAPL